MPFIKNCSLRAIAIVEFFFSDIWTGFYFCTYKNYIFNHENYNTMVANADKLKDDIFVAINSFFLSYI